MEEMTKAMPEPDRSLKGLIIGFFKPFLQFLQIVLIINLIIVIWVVSMSLIAFSEEMMEHSITISRKQSMDIQKIKDRLTVQGMFAKSHYDKPLKTAHPRKGK